MPLFALRKHVNGTFSVCFAILTFKTDLGCSFWFRPSFSDDTTVIDDCVKCRVFWRILCDVMADNISVLLN